MAESNICSTERVTIHLTDLSLTKDVPCYVGCPDQNLDQGSNFAQISKCSECDENRCHCVRLVFLIPAVYLLSQTESVWRRYRDLFAKPNRQKFDADCTCPYSPYRTRGRSVQDTWQVRTGHVAAPGDDTCQADLAFWAYGWTNSEVTRVTTGRVTRGTG
jgi:hypothetical protein